MKYITKVLSGFLVGIIFLVCTQSSSAHLGGGPPFLKINGKYSATNPYIQQALTKIDIAQDLAPNNYLPNQKISFEVDTTQLLFPKDILDQLEFRWYFTDDLKEFKTGQTIKHAYDTPGSYLVSLMVKVPGQEEYILLNSVQVNIIPNSNYKTPQTIVEIQSDSMKADEPVLFTARSTVDSSTSIKEHMWVVGDEKVFKGQQLCYTFNSPNLFTEVDHRVIDENGMYEDVSFSANGTDNILKFIPTVSTKNFPVKILSTKPSWVDFSCMSPKTIVLRVLIIIGSITVILIIFGLFFLKRSKNS